MNTQELKEYKTRVEHFLKGLTHVSTGACPGCPECGLEDEPDMDCEAYELAGESHFSHTACECCNSPLGGDRHSAHAVDPDTDEILHLDICTDCVFYIAYGEVASAA